MKTAREWMAELAKATGTIHEFYRRIQDDARNDGLEAAAELVSLRNHPIIVAQIRAMKSTPPLPALLPCPFDGEALQVENSAGQLYRVRCVMGCFRTPTFASEPEAIEYANRRATP